MNDQEQQSQEPQKPTTVSTTVTCPHCGKEHDVTVEIPEPTETPKLIWED